MKKLDKNEYRARLDEINDLVDRQDYKGALKIVDTIDWRRVRSARTLCMVGEIYEANKRYNDSRKLLLLAHQRAPIGRTVLYRLVELSIKMGNFDEAVDYYKRFVEVSPNDNSRYILKYKIYRARRSPIEDQIAILQEYKDREYTERWAYELARLYAKAGMTEACIEECDDLILWFSEGRYVNKAMELKMKFAPLTASQKEKFDSRFMKQSANRAGNLAGAAANAAVLTAETAKTADTALSSSQDEEIEEILKSITIGDISAQTPAETPGEEEAVPMNTAKPQQPENLQDKVAQGLRDVFQGGAEAEETAATCEPESSPSAKQEEYIVKDLEPENIHRQTGFKPFHVGGAMTMEVKAEAPKSQMFTPKSADTEAFKTDTKDLEFDLEALLAETANELAQAVAEETQPEGETEETAKAAETEQTKPVEAVQTAVPDTGLPAPAAARAAIVAGNLSAALSEKADEFDALAAGENTEETSKTTEQPEEAVENMEAEPQKEQAVVEVETESEEPEAVETAETVPEEAETVEEVETEPEEAEVIEEVETEPKVAEVSGTIEIPDVVEPAELEVPEGATKEIPVEAVKEKQGELDFSEVLAQELEDVVKPNKEESHMKRVTASVEASGQHSSHAFQTAVEGLMRHHLTEEEHRRLFTYFAPIPGMSQQINEALDTAQESACAKTSCSGNIIVTGREGSGKTRLSEGLIKALCKERQMEGARVAFLTAEQLNKKDPAAVVNTLAGGFLVVEDAGKLSGETVDNLSKAMEFKTNRLTVILEDLKPGIRALEADYPEFMKKFDSRVVIPVFTNDELVSFAKTYAKELGYKIDDMAVLALYTLIGDNQNEENPVAIGMVREMMDEAIKRASKKGRRPGRKVGKRHLDESGRIMLYEKDFDI
ncbi:MAG TPA: hypothetical protein H9858_06195 [Candidatus Blautia stercoravium]|nr:hypothetical protein [Candidatus Blautia stercoravium]